MRGPRPAILTVSSENQAFQHVETLQRKREKRQKHRELVVEGVRPINQALAHGWTIKALLYSREQPLSDWAEEVLARAHAPIHYHLALHLLRKLSRKTGTSELLALVAMPADDLARIPLRGNLLVVAFDRPASPGNLGTLIRSCDALGAHGLIVTGHAVDLYDPETISASTGSLFALPVVRLPSHKELIPWIAGVRATLGALQVVGTSEKADVGLAAHDFRPPTLLVAGNETWGMSAGYTALCDTLVRIPMVGSASSLNVAVATAIALYEIDRQRRCT
jgi:TrmH family RNA methyltransferase